MKRFYVDLTLHNQQNLGVKMQTHVYSDLQRILASQSITDVAVGFPDFGAMNTYGEATLGEKIRLVSIDSRRLEHILQSPSIRTVLAAGVLKASQVSSVPDHAKELRFSRNHKPTREKRKAEEVDSHLRDKRYETFRGESVPILIKRLDGSVYPLFIDRMEAESRAEGSFSSFGLSVKNGPTFPDF